jgi:hypothetical protein
MKDRPHDTEARRQRGARMCQNPGDVHIWKDQDPVHRMPTVSGRDLENKSWLSL